MEIAWGERAQRGLMTFGSVILCAPLLYIVYTVLSNHGTFFEELILTNYVVFLILPYVAFFAYYLVVWIESSRGPIQTRVAGVELRGAAGPLFFWLLIFLSMVLALKLFWIGTPAETGEVPQEPVASESQSNGLGPGMAPSLPAANTMNPAPLVR
jgi:hypothetical protein